MNIDIQPYLKSKPLSAYPIDLIKNMKMISFYHDEMATPFGSYIYRMQKYPGDVDLLEEFTYCCTAEEVVKKFKKRLIEVVNNITSEKGHYFSEFKAGIDKRYDIDIGDLINGKYDINPNLSEISVGMHKIGLFDDKELNKILNVMNNGRFNGDGYDIIYNTFRNRRILRWSADEILKGYKMLDKKIKKTLHDALFDETHIKIDMIAIYDDRFIEITNFIGLMYEDNKGDLIPININMKENHDILKQLPVEIEKLYFSNFHYSPFKMVKRIFSLSRHKRDERTLREIIPIVSGNISLLYQIKSEIDVILRIFKIKKVPPVRTIEKQIDNMKSRIVNILTFTETELEMIFSFLDLASNIKTNIQAKAGILEKLNESILKPHINSKTIIYLQKANLNPPPKYLLPKELSYAYFVRKPNENPKL